MTGSIPSVAYYDRDAPYFGARFEETSFYEAHQDWLPYLPAVGSKILDVGAGSGRDAIALEKMGYLVTAVEPSAALQKWSRQRHPQSRVEWMIDSLPALNKVKKKGKKYDAVLCSAVLMHVEPQHVAETFNSFSEVMSRHGIVAISVRDRQASDPVAIFHELPDDVIRHAAEAAGLVLLASEGNPDRLRRAGVRWRSHVFGRTPTWATR